MCNDHTPLILASSSPRRLELLQQLGVTPAHIYAPEINETLHKNEPPHSFVKRLACQKARAVEEVLRPQAKFNQAIFFAADTVVAIGREILQKPKTEQDARNFLHKLSGRSHKVFTAHSCIDAASVMQTNVSETRVRFSPLSAAMIDAYLKSEEWQGKAGGYAIQGRAGCFVERIVGSYSTIVGLDLKTSAKLLMGANYNFLENWAGNPTC